MVPHYFLKGFQKPQSKGRWGLNLPNIKGIMKLAVVIENADSNLRHSLVAQNLPHGELHVMFYKSAPTKVSEGPFGGPRKVWLSSSWDAGENVSFTSHPKFFNSILSFPR